MPGVLPVGREVGEVHGEPHVDRVVEVQGDAGGGGQGMRKAAGVEAGEDVCAAVERGQVVEASAASTAVEFQARGGAGMPEEVDGKDAVVAAAAVRGVGVGAQGQGVEVRAGCVEVAGGGHSSVLATRQVAGSIKGGGWGRRRSGRRSRGRERAWWGRGRGRRGGRGRARRGRRRRWRCRC